MPKVMFYTLGSAALGSMVLITANGSKASANAQGGMTKWTDDIEDDLKLYIMRMKNFNPPDVLQKFKKANPVAYARIFDAPLEVGNFTEDGFLVRQ